MICSQLYYTKEAMCRPVEVEQKFVAVVVAVVVVVVDIAVVAAIVVDEVVAEAGTDRLLL